MKRYIKIIVVSILFVGGISAVSALSQPNSLNEKGEIDITVTPTEVNKKNNDSGTLTIESAKEIALTKINGDIKFQYEEDNKYVFIVQKDNNLFEIEVDKNEGIIDDIKKISLKDVLSLEEAKTIALSQINGVIKKIEIGDNECEMEIEKDGHLYELKIDQFTKAIDVEYDSRNISLEEEKNIALKQVNGKIKGTEIENDEYTIYIEKDNYIYEIEIDKLNGCIVDVDKEKVKKNQKIISQDEAIKIAVNKVNGTVCKIDYDIEDNEYEIEIKNNDKYHYEITIDAENGKVNSVEKDD